VREDAPDLPPVKGDATQLSQAFLNLILNAAEAMQQGGTLQIATKVTEQGVTGPPNSPSSSPSSGRDS